jgi:alkylmercury lyase
MTGQSIWLRVSPEQVEGIYPVDAAISVVLVDPSREAMASVEAIWSAFCSHIHFFTSREEGERWAAGRDDIAILSVEEGFVLGRQVGVAILTGAA